MNAIELLEVKWTACLSEDLKQGNPLEDWCNMVVDDLVLQDQEISVIIFNLTTYTSKLLAKCNDIAISSDMETRLLMTILSIVADLTCTAFRRLEHTYCYTETQLDLGIEMMVAVVNRQKAMVLNALNN